MQNWVKSVSSSLKQLQFSKDLLCDGNIGLEFERFWLSSFFTSTSYLFRDLALYAFSLETFLSSCWSKHNHLINDLVIPHAKPSKISLHLKCWMPLMFSMIAWMLCLFVYLMHYDDEAVRGWTNSFARKLSKASSINQQKLVVVVAWVKVIKTPLKQS